MLELLQVNKTYFLMTAIEEAQKAKEKARVTKQKEQWVGRLQRKATNKVENELVNMGVRSAKKFLKGFIK